MTRTVYYTASTLDGFIATPDHSLDWLLSREIDAEGPMGYQDFEKSVGAIVMGSSTYRWIREHEPDSWVYTAPTWVFTHRSVEAPPGALHQRVSHRPMLRAGPPGAARTDPAPSVRPPRRRGRPRPWRPRGRRRSRRPAPR